MSNKVTQHKLWQKKRKNSKDDATVSIEELAEKASKGDKEALYALCESQAKGILFRTRQMLGNQMDAEDVSQNILIRLCQNIGSLRQPKAFKVWLGKIVLNEIRRYKVQNSKHSFVVDIDDYLETIPEENSKMLPHTNTESKEVSKAVMEAISRLPNRQREAFILHYYDDLSVTQIAQVMGIPHQNVSTHLARAREKIKEEFKEKAFGIRIDAMALLPLPTFIGEILQHEALSYLPDSSIWLTEVLGKCAQYISTGAITATAIGAAAGTGSTIAVATGVAAAEVTVASSASTITLSVLVGTIASLFLAGLIAFSVVLISPQGQPSITPEARPQAATAQEGWLEFSGGTFYRGTYRVNPQNAKPKFQNGGQITELSWKIISAKDEITLYESGGLDLIYVLALLRDEGKLGEYLLAFVAQDDKGFTYRLSGNFYIKDVPE